MDELNNHIEQVRQLCTLHGVKTFFAFGSVLSAKFNDHSDVDLVVDIDINDPIEYADNYFSLKDKLESVFDRPIDLLENKALKNPYLTKQINNTKVLIYNA